jgi:predicted Zn-dependent protease with MMP-like domain
MARDRRHLQRMLEDTVWHEVAHYFGMDEARVRRAERRRRLGHPGGRSTPL